MGKRKKLIFGYGVILIAIYESLSITVPGLKGIESKIFTIIWTVLPYIIMALALTIASFSHNVRKIFFNNLIISIVSIAGIYVLLDIRYIHPDPQGGIAEAIVPFLQIIGYIGLKIALAIYEDDSKNMGTQI